MRMQTKRIGAAIMTVAVVVASSALSSSAIGARPSDRAQNGSKRLGFVTLEQYRHGDLEGPAEILACSEQDFRDAMAQATLMVHPGPQPPVVDYSQQMILMIAAGSGGPRVGFCSGVDRVEIQSVSRSGNRLYVDVVLGLGPHGDMASPHHTVMVERDRNALGCLQLEVRYGIDDSQCGSSSQLGAGDSGAPEKPSLLSTQAYSNDHYKRATWGAIKSIYR